MLMREASLQKHGVSDMLQLLESAALRAVPWTQLGREANDWADVEAAKRVMTMERME